MGGVTSDTWTGSEPSGAARSHDRIWALDSTLTLRSLLGRRPTQPSRTRRTRKGARGSQDQRRPVRRAYLSRLSTIRDRGSDAPCRTAAFSQQSRVTTLVRAVCSSWEGTLGVVKWADGSRSHRTADRKPGQRRKWKGLVTAMCGVFSINSIRCRHFRCQPALNSPPSSLGPPMPSTKGTKLAAAITRALPLPGMQGFQLERRALWETAGILAEPSLGAGAHLVFAGGGRNRSLDEQIRSASSRSAPATHKPVCPGEASGHRPSRRYTDPCRGEPTTRRSRRPSVRLPKLRHHDEWEVPPPQSRHCLEQLRECGGLGLVPW